MSFSNLYDRKHIFKCLLWIGAVFGLMRVTGGSGYAIVIPMVFYCAMARKTESLFFWLLVSVCTLVSNPHIVLKGGGFAWMQRGVMLFLGCIMGINVMSYPLHCVIRPFVGMLFYIVVMALSSMQGWNPKISYLKLLLFTLVYFSYVGVSNQVGINSQVSSRKIRSVMLSMAILFILGSVVLVPFPGLSQLTAADFVDGKVDLSSFTSLFMGMTSHSQCLGPIVSVLSVILLGDLLFSIKKADPLYVSLLCCCPYLVYLTSSRTGMGSYILGHLFVLWIFMNARGLGARWKSKVMTIAMLIFTVLIIVLAFVPSVQNRIVRFLMKTSNNDTGPVTVEAVSSTRMGAIDESLRNFKKSPLIGNGFQVAKGMQNFKSKGFAILSAPIEKGVWVTAVLEEGGCVGFIVFTSFLIVCITKSIKRRAYIGASCLFVFTLSNLGEFSFFSMSYLGGFSWAMVFAGLALDIRKMKDENAAIQREMMQRQMQMEMMQAEGKPPFAG